MDLVWDYPTMICVYSILLLMQVSILRAFEVREGRAIARSMYHSIRSLRRGATDLGHVSIAFGCKGYLCKAALSGWNQGKMASLSLCTICDSWVYDSGCPSHCCKLFLCMNGMSALSHTLLCTCTYGQGLFLEFARERGREFLVPKFKDKAEGGGGGRIQIDPWNQNTSLPLII